MKTTPILTYDDFLENNIGHVGRWQVGQFCLILLQTVSSSLPFFLYFYSAFPSAHRCFVPICEEFPDNSSYHEAWTKFALPGTSSFEDNPKPMEETSQCTMFAVKDEAKGCLPESFDHTTVQPCKSYVYDRSIFRETLATELDLVCDAKYKVDFIGTIMMIGLMARSILGGPSSDKVGRKRTLTMALTVMGPSIVIEGFVVNYMAFLVFRFIIWTSACIMWISSNTLLVELFSKENRKKAFIFNIVTPSLTCTITVGVAYFERYWSYMHLWIGIAVCCTIPFIMYFLEESVRWLIINGKLAEAEAIVTKAASTNKQPMTEDEVFGLRHTMKAIAKNNSKASPGLTFALHTFMGAMLYRILILMSVWITTILSYYALSHKTTTLAGDIFLNSLLSFLADVPSTLIFLFFNNKGGSRRYCLALSHSILGICCIVMAFLPEDQSAAILATFLMGKFAASLNLNVIWLYTLELFPTNFRAQAIGLCSMVSRIFGMAAPFVASLGKFWSPLPMLVLGIPALVCGWLTILLPETAGKDLVEIKDVIETEEDVEI